jgi:hypothetical protein
MTITLTIQDVTSSNLHTPQNIFMLVCPTETLTVRELIRLRVYQEVEAYNEKQTDYFTGLVQPTDTERTLNGYRMTRPRILDWEQQFKRAVEAFEQNGFIVLVEDRQMESLDEVVTIAADTPVSFLKLIQLVGG